MAAAGNADDMGATNVKIACSGGKVIEGSGHDEGNWTQMGSCPKTHSICGLRGMIEGKQGNGDDTALNRIQLLCCQGNIIL